jgi:hypothetical protein
MLLRAEEALCPRWQGRHALGVRPGVERDQIDYGFNFTGIPQVLRLRYARIKGTTVLSAATAR